MDARNLKQAEVINDYILKGGDRATLELGTGFGKSRVAIEVLKHLQPKKVLILVNSTDLRDTTWEQEFKNFNFHEFFKERVELATYQLVYKWKSAEKDLTDYFIIADEVDFAGDVPELSKFFYEYQNVPVLGLTGFITASKRDWFASHLPVFATYTASDAQDEGILNNIHVVFVKYDLSKDPNGMTVEYTKNGVKKSFKQSENKGYDYAHAQFVKWIIAKEVSTTAFLKGEVSYEKYTADVANADYMIKQTTRNRAEMLINSSSSAEMAKKLVHYITKQDPENKVVVFSKRTAQIEKIVGKDHAYHGKIAKGKAKKTFDDFQSGASKILGVCDKINRGVNIDGLNTAIFETFYGSDTQAVQRFGRLLRLKPGETATAYILLPYFMRSTKIDGQSVYELSPTQQVTWVTKMLRSTVIKSSTVWDYRAVKDENI